MFKRFIFGLPVVATIGWEYRVWKRKLYYDRNREHFPGSTPFYGKMWGYESDYMIETSLNEGDMVFWSVDPLSIHIHESMARFPYRHIKGDYDAWDLCGIIRKRDGRAYVVGPHGNTTLYSDLVADYRTTTLAIRKLVDTSKSGTSRARLSSAIHAKPEGCDRYMRISPRGFFEYSVKAVVGRYFSTNGQPTRVGRVLTSLIRPESMSFPIPEVAGSDPLTVPMYEISDVFIDPIIIESESISYSPPFFVRRIDNEYYNHNRTKNIIVDWELLMQRDMKNKLVTKHQDDQRG